MKSKYLSEKIMKKLSKKDRDKVLDAERKQNIHEVVKKLNKKNDT